MIPERTLRKWRKEALIQVAQNPRESKIAIQAQRILRMTQELLDLHLKNKP